MSNNIILKKSSVGDKVPLSGDLQYGELALNYADGNLFYKNSSNAISTIASNKFVSVTGNITGGNIITTGSISSTGNITVGNVIYPGTFGTAGQFLTSYGNGQLYWSTSGGSVSGSLNVFLRVGSMTVSVIAGYLTVGTRTGNISVAVS